MPTPQPRRTVRAALRATAAATALVLPAAPAAAQDGTRSSDGLWSAVQAGDCIIVLYTENHPLFGPRRTNRNARWNGGCDGDGLAHGPGVFAAETRVSPFEGADYDERFEYRVTFQHGMIDGPGEIAEYNTRRTPSLTLAAVPRRATNPSVVFHRAGCEYFVQPNGKIDAAPFWKKCDAASGATLRERVRAAAEAVRRGAQPPSAPSPAANPASGVQPGGAATPVASDGVVDPARRRLLHNPAASAMDCATLRRQPNGRNYIVNDCGVPIEAFWCSVTSGECERGSGNSWTIGVNSNWPLSSGEYRWAACRGRDSGKFDKDSQGTRYICPDLNPPR
ncbi:hypothetical protein [Sphingomonas flavalba]|uniref:hypothetical protein n=1 Tax=Sphingomonas flavalba TaxID=2559804 RepID=UPI00109DC713|nr:hypothetical protein [Sphingomonas flavalba]